MDRAVFIGAILTTSFTAFSVLTNFAMFCDFHKICKLRVGCGPFDHLPHYILHCWWILHILKNLQILLEPSWSSPSLLLNNFSQFLQNSHNSQIFFLSHYFLHCWQCYNVSQLSENLQFLQNSQILVKPSLPDHLSHHLLHRWQKFAIFCKICNFCRIRRIHRFCRGFLDHLSHYFYIVDKFYNFSRLLENLQFLQNLQILLETSLSPLSLVFTLLTNFVFFLQYAQNLQVLLEPSWTLLLPLIKLWTHNFTIFYNFHQMCNFYKIRRFLLRLSWPPLSLLFILLANFIIFRNFHKISQSSQILLGLSWPPLSLLFTLLTNFIILAKFAIFVKLRRFCWGFLDQHFKFWTMLG